MNFYDDFSSEEEIELQLNNHRRIVDEHQARRAWQDMEVDVDRYDDGAAMALPLRRRQLPAVPSPPLSLNWMNLSPYGFPESVALSELPGSKFRGRYRDLHTDISMLKGLDISDVVVLLTMAEFRKFRVPTLLTEYESAGFLVFHFPIEDGMVPEDVLGLASLIEKIRKRVADGHRVLVHCYGGLGRAVLIGACLLQVIDEDIAPDEVITQLRELRGSRAVQSVKQYNFISEFRDLCINAQYLAAEREGCVSR
jgi:cyclin-dependent kinase inhibitor 3